MFMVLITIVTGVYKQLITGGPHIVQDGDHLCSLVSKPPCLPCVSTPPSYISIECRNRGGEEVAKPGHGKRCQEGLYIIIFD